jgi:hypothetical protein
MLAMTAMLGGYHARYDERRGRGDVRPERTIGDVI